MTDRPQTISFGLVVLIRNKRIRIRRPALLLRRGTPSVVRSSFYLEPTHILSSHLGKLQQCVHQTYHFLTWRFLPLLSLSLPFYLAIITTIHEHFSRALGPSCSRQVI